MMTRAQASSTILSALSQLSREDRNALIHEHFSLEAIPLNSILEHLDTRFGAYVFHGMILNGSTESGMYRRLHGPLQMNMGSIVALETEARVVFSQMLLAIHQQAAQDAQDAQDQPPTSDDSDPS